MTVSAVLAVVSLGCTVAVWRFITFDRFNLDSRLPFGGGINPPGVSLGVYACFIALTLYFAEMALRNVKSGILEKVACGLVFIGRHTLYIFLYHLLFRDVILPKLIIKTGISMESIPVRWIVYLPVMVFAPLLIELILEKFHKVVLEAYGLKTK